jgi:hypothetical protein
MANAMALAAAQQLIGTEVSTANASAASRQAVAVLNNHGNKYDFAGITLGVGTTALQSEVPEPTYFASAAGAGDGTAPSAGGSDARVARVEVRAEAPLIFFGLILQAQDRKLPLAAAAVAGISAPVCTACGIEPMAIAAVDAEDTTNFGYVSGTRYTMYFQCNGNPLPGVLGDAGTRVPYLLLNRYNESAQTFAAEDTQLFRNGNSGIPPSSSTTQACVQIGAAESIWATATPPLCNATAPNPSAQQFLCGLNNRFDNSPLGACANITDVDLLSTGSTIDTDLADTSDYTAYAGNGRRLITLSIVDTLSATASMNVLGFRQFLLMPDPNNTELTPTDSRGRFIAMYIGNPAPLKQGRFGNCGITAGPGKVVLHQ